MRAYTAGGTACHGSAGVGPLEWFVRCSHSIVLECTFSTVIAYTETAGGAAYHSRAAEGSSAGVGAPRVGRQRQVPCQGRA